MPHARVDIIFDTDMSIDVDDVGALCVLHALEDRGEAKLLAAVHNSASPEGVGAISAINDYFGRSHVPIGAYAGDVGSAEFLGPSPNWYQSPWGFARVPPAVPWQIGPYVPDLVANFPSRVRNASNADGDAVSVMRSALAAAADHSVTIVSVGYATNLHDLLRSPGGAASPLSGIELVTQKVARLVMMGGRHTFGQYDPVEWNFAGADNGISVCGGPGKSDCGAYNNLGAVTNRTLAMWPAKRVPLIFIDFETGVNVWTGEVLATGAPVDSPCRRAYDTFCTVNDGWCHYNVANGGYSRCSWDIQAVVFAVRGTEDIYTLEPGHTQVTPSTGYNLWTVGGAGCHDDPTYVDGPTGYTCASFAGFECLPCYNGHACNGIMAATLVQSCPESCTDVTPVCPGPSGAAGEGRSEGAGGGGSRQEYTLILPEGKRGAVVEEISNLLRRSDSRKLLAANDPHEAQEEELVTGTRSSSGRDKCVSPGRSTPAVAVAESDEGVEL